jgi:hypothetical protein
MNSCAGCRYWKSDLNRSKGVCEAPIPASVWGLYGKSSTKADDGTECGSFRKRIVRQRKIVGIAASIHALDASRHGHD